MTVAIHSIWLMPAAAAEVVLRDVVAELAARFGTPAFAPHLTVRGDTDMSRGALETAIAAAAKQVRPFVETIAAIETGETFFRSFYARFAVAPALQELKRALDPQGLADFMPHVSLLYGAVEAGAKAAAARAMGERLAGRSIGFDRLCVVTSGQEIPIDQWRVVATAPLGGLGIH